jgi:DNA-binding transcriptional ArsR family regulator
MSEHFGPSRKELLRWAEQMALYFAEVGGLPLIGGRIVGWLMVCDPAEQTAEEIAEAIGASRASLSTNLRLLTTLGMVRRTTRSGERMRYFSIEDQTWVELVRRQVASLASFTSIVAGGLELLGPDRPNAGRLREAHRVFSWMKEVFDSAPFPPSSTKDPE